MIIKVHIPWFFRPTYHCGGNDPNQDGFDLEGFGFAIGPFPLDILKK